MGDALRCGRQPWDTMGYGLYGSLLRMIVGMQIGSKGACVTMDLKGWIVASRRVQRVMTPCHQVSLKCKHSRVHALGIACLEKEISSLSRLQGEWCGSWEKQSPRVPKKIEWRLQAVATLSVKVSKVVSNL